MPNFDLVEDVLKFKVLIRETHLNFVRWTLCAEMWKLAATAGDRS